jgi:hypothetical protein
MEGRCPQQRDSLVHLKIFHERVDPARWIGRAGYSVFGPEYEEEAALRADKTMLADEPGGGPQKGGRRQSKVFEGLLPGEVGPAARRLLVEVSV